jgi:hypothetical protein
MGASIFDTLAAKVRTDATRRGIVASLLAMTMTIPGVIPAAEAKKKHKKKKKRCKPTPLGAICTTSKECCPQKTGRSCASSAKGYPSGCNASNNVCCLPVNALGCVDSCDCCGDFTGCSVGGQCLPVV